MFFKFDRNGNSNLKFFNYDTEQYEPVYKIEKCGRDWVVFDRRTGRIECASLSRKLCEQEMASRDYDVPRSEIEDGFGQVGM